MSEPSDTETAWELLTPKAAQEQFLRIARMAVEVMQAKPHSGAAVRDAEGAVKRAEIWEYYQELAIKCAIRDQKPVLAESARFHDILMPEDYRAQGTETVQWVHKSKVKRK